MDFTKGRYTLWDAVGTPLKIAPLQAGGVLLQRIGNGVMSSISVLVTAAFIDGVLRATAKNLSFGTALWPFMGVLLVTAWHLLSGRLVGFLGVSMTNRLRKALRVAISDKRARLQYAHLENQETWDLIGRVSLKPEEKWRDMFDLTLNTLAMVIQVLGLLVVVMTQVWWAGLVLLASAIPLLRIAMKFGERSYQTEREVTKIERMYRYLGKVMTEREAVEERSLFGYNQALNQTWFQQYETARLKKYRVDKQNFISMKIGGIACVGIALIIMASLLAPTLNQTISVGMYMSLVIAIFNMTNMLSWNLGYNTREWVKNREFMKDVEKFAALSEVPDALCLPETVAFESLEFRDVIFRYPGTEEVILRGLSFLLRQGEHIAFVGANGAGKTTLTKLILGLYLPDQGEIFLNGKPLSSYSPAQRKGLCAVVFQDFARYQVTLRENLLLGHAKAGEAQLQQAVGLSGLEPALAKLPQGMDTLLGKLKEGGQDLSGGEWQRLAMARALINPAPLRILDEPTAALDPISESRLYKQFEAMSQDHATIFISHRLGSTQLADRIYVLEGGKVVEEGTHAALLDARGIYAAMFDSQRSWYL